MIPTFRRNLREVELMPKTDIVAPQHRDRDGKENRTKIPILARLMGDNRRRNAFDDDDDDDDDELERLW